MAENEKQTNTERLKDITDSIERGIEDLFQSDKYAQYLRTMSRFHKYSVNNTMLIYMQKPDATLVAGFNKWRDQFERNVMKGEKGIKIIAPTPFKKKIEQEKRDPDTNLPMLDSDGIYMLYDGNTEAMAFEAEDIALFSGCFGITREDWDAIKDEVPPMDLELIKQKREQLFLESPGDTYAIYQLKRDDATADLRFMNSEYLQKKGIEPQYKNYELVYSGALTKDDSRIEKLEDLYRIFNIERPQDFTGHSLSISDIVALKQAGVVSYHYVDSIGYKELANFHPAQNYLKNAEMQMEDDYGMIDGVINNGPKEEPKAVKQTEEIKSKKPSVLAKLRQYQKADREQNSQHRSAERDLI